MVMLAARSRSRRRRWRPRSELVRRGDYATWRAARAVGDHDLNTFSVRADPTGDVDALEPGMTVLWPEF